MAVPEQTPYKEYTGNGVTRSFSLGFICKKKEHLIVKINDAEVPVNEWSLTGENVIFNIAPGTNEKISLQRKTPNRRTTNYQSFNNSFNPTAINEDLDTVWLRLQEEDVAKFLLNQLINMNYEDLDKKGQDIRLELINRLTEKANQLNDQILQQGVAQHQLQNYYDFLLSQMANLSSNKNWLASLIADASGQNQQWVNDKKTLKTFYDFGAKGNGIDDDTTAIRLATVYSAMYNVRIVQNDGEFLVSTFDQTLSDGIVCAIPIVGNLRLSGTGRIKSNQTGTTRAIFGIDERANGGNISISGIKFTGAARYRAIHSTTTAELSSLDVIGVRTQCQSIVLTSDIKKSIRVKNNRIGEDITSTTDVTPTVVVTIPKTSINFPEYDCSFNLLLGGTETTTGTSYAFHNIPQGGKADNNVLINIGKSQTEGYDIDGLGRMASFSRNVAIFSGFEYKVGTDGLVRSRDIFFHDNLSWESFGAAFSIRSSCNARGNIAYNPKGWGLWMGAGSDPNEMLKKSAIIDVDAFKIIWAGSSWPGAVKIEAIAKAFDLKKLSIEVDPAYKLANPTAKITATSGSILNIDGDFDNLSFDGLFVGDSAVDQVNIRPTTRAKNIHFFKPKFGNCDDSCIDINNTDNFIVHDPEFPETAGDRPIRMSGCDLVDIKAKNFQNIDNLISTPNNQYVTVNGYGAEPVGASGRPLGTKWRVGSIVTNTFDSSIWLKVLASSGESAWKKLTSSPVSVAYDPPSLEPRQIEYWNVTVTGARLGDMVVCSFNRALNGTRIWAEVTSANLVTVYHQNPTAAAVDLPSGTLAVKLI